MSMRFFMASLLLAGIFSVAALSVYGGDRPEEVFEELFSPHIFNTSDDTIDYKEQNVLLYYFLYLLSEETDRAVLITDVCRPGSTGQHEHCNAVDFYLDYDHLEDLCEVWEQYLIDADLILERAGEFGVPVRVGLYTDLHHHIDITGKQGLWGIDFNGNEKSYVSVYNELVDRLEAECD